jgi:ABC-type sugar transport system permease subunit
MFQKSRRSLIIPFLLPQTVLYIIFTLIPLGLTVLYSMTDWHGPTLKFNFVGLHQFRIIPIDTSFLNAVQNNFYFMLVGGLLMLIPAMIIAWALHEPIRFKPIFRFIVLAPTVLAASVVGLMWKWMYNPSFGLFNPLLKAIGLEKFAIAWLGEPDTALTAVIIAMVWYKLGLWVMLLTAGLERIPEEMLDAAKIDGAGEWMLLFKITLPLMWETLRVVLILWIVLGLQEFTIIYVMTGPTTFTVGGPLGSTELMATYVFKNAFSTFNWAYAMSMAVIMLIMIFVLSGFSNRLTQRETIEY